MSVRGCPATEYISGTTQNPLVVGANDTTNSEKRIFASDGNVTMFACAVTLRSPPWYFAHIFASTCATLFARMLDTVPSCVELTDVIDPLPVKPAAVTLILDGATLKLSGLVRLWGDNRAGAAGNATLVDDHQSTSMGCIPSAWYAFNSSNSGPPAVLVNATAGITRLRFTVDEKMEDQGGVGFAVQDGVVFSASSGLMKTGFPSAGRFDIAVRNGLNSTRVFLEQDVRDSVDRVSVQETDIAPPAQPVSAGTGTYSLWNIDVSDDNSYTIGWEVDGVKFSTVDSHSLFDLDACTPQRRRRQDRGLETLPYSCTTDPGIGVQNLYYNLY
ncbi:hypothetical protein B0H17DRAFT_1211667 [Mycena rosella]|uniref:Uncharacterized protein n=1 Tax=Mycena rosella TaxID=1033263 RepID=A0AAD7CU05_MYCRO|nr:hypothetical protein B0H17DRAFT_1211667 [Mycena rosella]